MKKSVQAVRLAVALAAGLGCGAAMSEAPPMFRPLIIAAIDSTTGEAKRMYSKDEQWVKLMRSKLGTDGPVTVTTRVVKRWKQEGCARVETAFKFHDAKFDEKTRAMVDDGFAFEVNTCRDGQPPIESVDLRTLREGMEEAHRAPPVKTQSLGVDKDGRIRSMGTPK